MLVDRFPGATAVEDDATPPYFAVGKALTRSRNGSKTHFRQLEQLLHDGIPLPAKASDIKKQLDIGDNAWKSLMREDRTKDLLRMYGVKRVGSGSGARWVSEAAA